MDNSSQAHSTGPRVTGLGGVFYVVRDPEATHAWYRDTLGIDGPYGPQLAWADEPKQHPYSLVSHFADDEYIKPGTGGFMINLRVDDCDGFVAALRAKGVEILGEADEGYGKFAWLLDPDRVKMAKAFLRGSILLAGALALAGCGSLVPGGSSGAAPGSASASASNGAGGQARPATRVSSAPQSYAASAEERACLADLGASGARFERLPDTYAAPGCNKLGTVQLSALAGDRSTFGVSNLGPVRCRVAKAFGDWARFGVDRAAREILGSPIAKIETMGSYACRKVAGTERLSAHARAEAIDVSGFVLADGRRIVLKRDWDGGDAATREFLRVVHKSACKRFGTVLGPEYNAAHEDHFHLEGTGAKFCR